MKNSDRSRRGLVFRFAGGDQGGRAQPDQAGLQSDDRHAEGQDRRVQAQPARGLCGPRCGPAGCPRRQPDQRAHRRGKAEAEPRVAAHPDEGQRRQDRPQPETGVEQAEHRWPPVAEGQKDARVEDRRRHAIADAEDHRPRQRGPKPRQGRHARRAERHDAQRPARRNAVAKGEHRRDPQRAAHPMGRDEKARLRLACAQRALEGRQGRAIKRLADAHHDEGRDPRDHQARMGPQRRLHPNLRRRTPLPWPGTRAVSTLAGLRPSVQQCRTCRVPKP